MCEQNVELLNFNTANGILLDVVHSLHEGFLLSEYPRVSAYTSKCISFTPIKKYGLPCADFQETRNFKTTLYADFLALNFFKIGQRCVDYG